jgi:pSer/pThr/pTyr-binding forkhead associated (FHA) protein
VRLTGSGYDLVAAESGAHNLGRAKDAPLRIDHPTVSRKHARIIISDDRSVAYLQDTGGANGTILNGVALQELKPLNEGDRIRIGEVELLVALRRA